MGIQSCCMVKDEHRELMLGNLNYSGILNSPFEYYSDQMKKQESELSLLFENLLIEKNGTFQKKTFKWNLGKIDQNLQKQRYTPIYQQRCGIVNGNITVSQNQFKEKWQSQFIIAKKNIKFDYSQQNKQQAKQFDFLCYKTILFYVYKVNSLQSIDKTNIKPYQQFMHKFYSKSFLREDKKINSLLNFIEQRKIDVMFIQQATKQLIKQVDQTKYKIISRQKSQSIIILKKSSFQVINKQEDMIKNFPPDLSDDINWNNDTVIGFADRLIFISGHLSSKSDKNSQQVQGMMKSIARLQNIYPLSRLIIGCDTNCFLNEDHFKKITVSFSCFPKKNYQKNQKIIPTTFKKRTMLQPQCSKAEIQVNQCRDYIISSLQITQSKVVSIQNVASSTIGYIPCQKHPFDHFVIVGLIYI